MKIIGIDPGSKAFGIAILETEGNKIMYLNSAVIYLKEKELLQRLKKLWFELNSFIKENNIDDAGNSVAVEEGFVGKNIKSADTLAKIRGLTLGVFISKGWEAKMYSPREIKKALTGSGNAGKEQVARMISTLLNIDVSEFKDDETDAISIAYCHALSMRRRY